MVGAASCVAAGVLIGWLSTGRSSPLAGPLPEVTITAAAPPVTVVVTEPPGPSRTTPTASSPVSVAIGERRDEYGFSIVSVGLTNNGEYPTGLSARIAAVSADGSVRYAESEYSVPEVQPGQTALKDYYFEPQLPADAQFEVLGTTPR